MPFSLTVCIYFLLFYVIHLKSLFTILPTLKFIFILLRHYHPSPRTVCHFFHFVLVFILWFILWHFFLFISPYPIPCHKQPSSRSWINFGLNFPWLAINKNHFGRKIISLLSHYRMISFSQWTLPACHTPQAPSPTWNSVQDHPHRYHSAIYRN